MRAWGALMFQSSPSREAGRYVLFEEGVFAGSYRFQSSPSREAGRYGASP